ncbi:bacteriocin secretion accessory protein [Enterococcus faecium]|nr:bacteriocin secretion accessory protein [Enterococcus faecium]MBK4754820.1 Bacteriocin export accessory protein [Enterococcus faecium]MBK4760014.1 Bacteriocin export accessory protein [Enterococcus faecium]MBK4803540.1 Bacteriocin export accessory protein [Enterococcus faecium]MBK4816913.1 Bacteriocin export accessory protein [Enterococcus faecium]MCK1012663.1 bacteriocin secretion accessory protein [Enterococcus faecium]
MFLTFAKKEVVIRTTAQLNPEKIEKLQVPLEAKIMENFLKENQFVHKDDVLVRLDCSLIENEKAQIEQENQRITQQIKMAQLFIESISKGKNLFSTDDSFGYSNQLKSMLSEKESLRYALKQSELNDQKQLEVYEKTKRQLEKQIESSDSKLQEWQQVQVAWSNNQSLKDFSKEMMANYENWQEQLNNVSDDQKNQVKLTISASINEQIEQLKKEVEQYQSEKAKLVKPTTSENDRISQTEKGKQELEQAITTVKQTVTELNEKQEKNQSVIKSLDDQLSKGILKAPVSGTVHLNEETKGQAELAKGTVLAEIYPIHEKSKMKFTALLPANESTYIKEGMKVHFKLDQKGGAPITIDGTLDEISENSTATEKGVFYAVKGTLKTTQSFPFRYGLTGELSLIVGEKTYWQQIVDVFLNKK